MSSNVAPFLFDSFNDYSRRRVDLLLNEATLAQFLANNSAKLALFHPTNASDANTYFDNVHKCGVKLDQSFFLQLSHSQSFEIESNLPSAYIKIVEQYDTPKVLTKKLITYVAKQCGYECNVIITFFNAIAKLISVANVKCLFVFLDTDNEVLKENLYYFCRMLVPKLVVISYEKLSFPRYAPIIVDLHAPTRLECSENADDRLNDLSSENWTSLHKLFNENKNQGNGISVMSFKSELNFICFALFKLASTETTANGENIAQNAIESNAIANQVEPCGEKETYGNELLIADKKRLRVQNLNGSYMEGGVAFADIAQNNEIKNDTLDPVKQGTLRDSEEAISMLSKSMDSLDLCTSEMDVPTQLGNNLPTYQRDLPLMDEPRRKQAWQVGYVYDKIMLKHKSRSKEAHNECPERVIRIHKELNRHGLLEKLVKIDSQFVQHNDLLLLHTEAHIKRVKEISSGHAKLWNQFEAKYCSVYMGPSTWNSACYSAGSTLHLLRSILSGEVKNGFAIVRPPGHHAEEDQACGFCYFNNAALAAKCAIQEFGKKRVLIVDWDVHHGNGTQKAFYEDEKVLFVSIHSDNLYPVYTTTKLKKRGMSGFDQPHKIGSGNGLGHNINIPFKYRSGDAAYMQAFIEIIMPRAIAFAPDLVIISSGFDAAMGDPLGRFEVTPNGYAFMTNMLMGLANGQVLTVLEGGYNLLAISNSATAVCAAMAGLCGPVDVNFKEDVNAYGVIKKVKKCHERGKDLRKFGTKG